MLPVRRAAAPPAPRGAGPPRESDGTRRNDQGLRPPRHLPAHRAAAEDRAAHAQERARTRSPSPSRTAWSSMADSSAKRLEDRLGNVLVKQGKLGKERLDEALADPEGDAAAPGAHPHHAELHHAARTSRTRSQVQVSQIVFKVFRWRDGEYHFEPTDTVDYDRENFNPMSADFILMEGIRMVDEWPIIEKKIPSMDIVFGPWWILDDRGGRGRRRTSTGGASGSAARPAPRARSASPPRRSASTARSTARGPCRPSSTPRAWASSRSAASSSTSSTGTSSRPSGRGAAKRGRSGPERERRPPRRPGYRRTAAAVLLAARRRLSPRAHALRGRRAAAPPRRAPTTCSWRA